MYPDLYPHSGSISCGPALDLQVFLRVDVRCGKRRPERSLHRGFYRHGHPVPDNRTDCEV